MKRLVPLFLLASTLAGCATQPSGVFPTAAEFKERHPTWTDEVCERMSKGQLWIGMTERQFLHQMRRHDRKIEWNITTTPLSRVYRHQGTADLYLVDLDTLKLTDWVIFSE